MILLDTNILSEPMRPSPNNKVIKWLDDQIVSELFICAVTRAELELGIALLPDGKRKKKLFSAAHEILKKLRGRCLPFGEDEAPVYAQIIASARKTGHTITVEDGQIASVALSNNFTLATRNVKDFEMIDRLKIVNPFE